MKALTLHQPWASLIIDGRKPVETRGKNCKHRGPLAIHAGLTVDREACARFGYDPDAIPRGCVLGSVEMVDSVQFPHFAVTPDPYGDYSAGRWGYVLENPVSLAAPVAARGYQWLWDWNLEASVLIAGALSGGTGGR